MLPMIFNTPNTGYDRPYQGPQYGEHSQLYYYLYRPAGEHHVRDRYGLAVLPLPQYQVKQEEDGGLDMFLGLRQEVLDTKIGLLTNEIDTRQQLKQANLYRMNLDQCECQNQIMLLGQHLWDKRRMQLEQHILRLEEEKRREETSCFRDIMFLNKELRLALIEGLEERQKAAMLRE